MHPNEIKAWRDSKYFSEEDMMPYLGLFFGHLQNGVQSYFILFFILKMVNSVPSNMMVHYISSSILLLLFLYLLFICNYNFIF